jgi:hypothetical protein
VVLQALRGEPRALVPSMLLLFGEDAVAFPFVRGFVGLHAVKRERVVVEVVPVQERGRSAVNDDGLDGWGPVQVVREVPRPHVV